MPKTKIQAIPTVPDGLMQEIAIAIEEQHFGEEKTNQIKEKLAKTNFFQWFDAYKATQNKP